MTEAEGSIFDLPPAELSALLERQRIELALVWIDKAERWRAAHEALLAVWMVHREAENAGAEVDVGAHVAAWFPYLEALEAADPHHRYLPGRDPAVAAELARDFLSDAEPDEGPGE